MRQRFKKVAEKLLAGVGDVEACKQAGYSDVTAESHSKRIIEHPEVQSILTRAMDRVLAEEGKTFDDILRPHVRALDATIVARTKYGVRKTKLPDHAIRMQGAEHLQGLHRAKDPEHDRREGGGGGNVAFVINFLDQGAQPGPTIISPPAQASNHASVPALLLQRTEPGQAGPKDAGGGVVVVAPPVPAVGIRSSPGVLSSDQSAKPLNPNGNGHSAPKVDLIYPGVTFLHGGA